MRKKAELVQNLQKRLIELNELSQGAAERTAVVELDQSSVGRLSRVDAMQRQAINIETQRRRETERARINLALSRVAEDEFGYCTNCGEPISFQRLELDPSTPNCIECAK